MSKDETVKELHRLIGLISDDEELLSKANRYMQRLEEEKKATEEVVRTN